MLPKLSEATAVEMLQQENPQPAQIQLSSEQTPQINPETLLIGLNEVHHQILQCSGEMVRNSQVKPLIGSLQYHISGFGLAPLGDAGCQSCPFTRKLLLNAEAVERLLAVVPLKDAQEALLIYGFHEMTHHSQKLGEYADVSKLKRLTGSSEVMGKFDMDADYLAHHTLSLFYTLQEVGVHDEDTYIKHFYHLWCEVSGTLINTFLPGENKVKQQRAFGYLLKAALTYDAYWYNRRLVFKGALWPCWEDLDQIAIVDLTTGYLWLRPTPVNSKLMEEILSAIETADFSLAFSLVQELLRQLHKI
jgi:hypothetical protein